MDVVGGAADGVGQDAVVFADAGDVGPEVGLEMFGDGFAAVFGGEDDVEGVLGVGVRHGAVYIMWGEWFQERDVRSGAGICTYEACIAPPIRPCRRQGLRVKRRLGLSLQFFPGLPAWAKLCRASLRRCRRQRLRARRRWFGRRSAMVKGRSGFSGRGVRDNSRNAKFIATLLNADRSGDAYV
jgi:hypothetical protein